MLEAINSYKLQLAALPPTGLPKNELASNAQNSSGLKETIPAVQSGPLQTSEKTDVSFCLELPKTSSSVASSVRTIGNTCCSINVGVFMQRFFFILPDRKLKRGVSKQCENASIINRARDLYKEDVMGCANGSLTCDINRVIQMSGFSFHLPDFSSFDDDLRAFMEKELIELSTLNSLEQVGRLEKNRKSSCYNVYMLINIYQVA